jgi:hypothetical protein
VGHGRIENLGFGVWGGQACEDNLANFNSFHLTLLADLDDLCKVLDYFEDDDYDKVTVKVRCSPPGVRVDGLGAL